MNTGEEHILTINTGSSSIKFAIYRCGEGEELHSRGEISQIGSPEGVFSLSKNDKVTHQQGTYSNHEQAFQKLTEWLQQESSELSISAIAHRVVHGGQYYHRPVLIDSSVIDRLKNLIEYDPLHMTSEVMGIQLCNELYPEATQVACFDTAFHHTLPQVAHTLPLTHQLIKSGVRKYGFHGLSYEYIQQTLEKDISFDEANGKLIIAHLGSGASIAALKEGKSTDTSMSFTSNSGLVMSTRCGDIDPGLLMYLIDSNLIQVSNLRSLLNSDSGLKGISNGYGDMKLLLEREGRDPDAKLAIEIFCYTIRKYIGAYAAALEGIDTLVFTGGIGEHSAPIRNRICSHLTFLGIDLDEEKNRHHQRLISSDRSHVNVRVIPTNEELMIARHANSLMRSNVS